MGFEDHDFESAKSRMNENLYNGKDRSSSQLYKQAGNSIVVDVLLHIMENLYDAMPYLFDDMVVGSFFSGIGAFEKALTKLDMHRSTGSPSSIGEEPDLQQVGYINDYNGDANRVYDGSGISRTLKQTLVGGCKDRMVQSGVIVDDTMGFDDKIRLYDGFCPSIRASRQGLKAIIPENITSGSK